MLCVAKTTAEGVTANLFILASDQHNQSLNPLLDSHKNAIMDFIKANGSMKIIFFCSFCSPL